VRRSICDCIANYFADFDAACLVEEEHVGGGWLVDASGEEDFAGGFACELLTYCHKVMLNRKCIVRIEPNIASINNHCA